MRVPPGCTIHTEVAVRMGPVQCDPARPMHWGARKLTNNTAEMSAMRAACDEVVADVAKGESAIIASDSSYVIGKVLAGRLVHSKHEELYSSPC